MGNTALRDGARTSTHNSSVAKRRTASIPCRPDLGLCLVKTLSTALTCWPYGEHGAPGRRPNIHAQFVGRQTEDGLDTLPTRSRVVSCKDSFHGTDVLAVWGTRRSGTAPEHPRTIRRSPNGGRPRYPADPISGCVL